MIFVSRCLIGENCKYNGKNNYNQKVVDFLKNKDYITICPETMGGLTIPRSPSEIENGKGSDVLINKTRVISRENRDVTREFIKGAKLSLELAKKYKPDLIILKAKSPSCGKGKVYDGTFSKVLTDGNGVACQILIDNGFNVITEDEL